MYFLIFLLPFPTTLQKATVIIPKTFFPLFNTLQSDVRGIQLTYILIKYFVSYALNLKRLCIYTEAFGLWSNSPPILTYAEFQKSEHLFRIFEDLKTSSGPIDEIKDIKHMKSLQQRCSKHTRSPSLRSKDWKRTSSCSASQGKAALEWEKNN